MHDIAIQPNAIQPPRKANECFIDNERFREARPLFDEFWREGELALLFGAAGTGKSVLGVQIAEALARGKPLGGLRMPTGRTKTLYVDLVLRDSQFQARYTTIGSHATSYKFAERLYRDRPRAGEDLIDWLRAAVTANGFRVVVIDDLSAVKNTHDGTLETLALMRRLRQLCDGLDISILVLTDSNTPGRSGVASAADLGRSRVLCSVADSAFALGRREGKGYDRYIVQTRSRGASAFWTEQNAPAARIERLDNGMLGFAFDDRFAAEIDEETRQLILRIKSMHDKAHTFRVIAETLGISKTRVHRLYKKWTPAMEPEKPESEPVPEFYALDRCIYVGCMDCNFCGGRRGNNRRAAGTNINGHKDCPDDCDLCGPRPYAANDTTADPKLKELSDKFYVELREWLLAGKTGERPQYPGAKRYGVKGACWFPGSEDWSETELKEYTLWKIKGYFDQQAAALALRGRTPSSPPAGGGVAVASTDGVVGGDSVISDAAQPDPSGSAAVAFTGGNGGKAAEEFYGPPVKQSFTANRAAQPPAPGSPPGLRRGDDASSAGWSADAVVRTGSDSDRVNSAEPKPRTIYDLKRSIDGHGEEIYIQTECKTTGKPTLWYKPDRHKNNVRYQRGTAGITTTRLGKTEMLC